jgi:hypothetical protein
MREQPGLKDGAPLLLPGARIECFPGTNLPVLHLAAGPILLSEGAAAILSLCDGTRSRLEIQLRLLALGYRESSTFLDPFLDAARERKWVVDLRLPAVHSAHVPVFAEP